MVSERAWLPDRRVSSSGGLPARLLVVLMVVAVVVNVFQFIGIEQEPRHNYQALFRYETGDVFEAAISRDNSARRRVAPFYYFGELFPGSTVIMPAEEVSMWFPIESSMVAFGREPALEARDYDPVDLVSLEEFQRYRLTAESFAPDAGATLRILDERVGYYVGKEPSGTFVIVTPDGPPGRRQPIAFVDLALLDDETLQELTS